MNLLLNELPSKVKIGDIEIQINTDFRISINFGILIDEYNLDIPEERTEFYNKALKLYYPIWNMNFNEADDNTKNIMNYCADHVQEAIDGFLWFHRCGKDLKENLSEGENKQPVYSFEYDSDKIIAAFKDQYNTDLVEEKIHWWKFKAYFDSLKEDNEICKIISIRARNLNDIQDKQLKEHYRKLKKIYKIPLPDEEGIDSEELEILMHGGNFSKLEK